MPKDLHVHIHVDPPVADRQILQELQHMSEILADVQAQTAALADKVTVLQMTVDTKQEAIAAAIAALEAKIANAPSIDAELVAIKDQLAAANAGLDAATQDIADTPVPATDEG